MAVVTDPYGIDIYVSNRGKKEDGTEGRVDIFDPQGVFITEIKTPPAVESSPSGEPRARVKAIAVDGTGVLYIAISEFAGVRILRYSPGLAITRQPVRACPYPDPPELVHFIANAFIVGLAINSDELTTCSSTTPG